MRKYKTIKKEVEEKIVEKANCDYCNKEFDERTTLSNGFGTLYFDFGFGSSFDDDNFRLDICDDCFLINFYLMLKKQFKGKEYNLNVLEEKYNELVEENNKK